MSKKKDGLIDKLSDQLKHEVTKEDLEDVYSKIKALESHIDRVNKNNTAATVLDLKFDRKIKLIKEALQIRKEASRQNTRSMRCGFGILGFMFLSIIIYLITRAI